MASYSRGAQVFLQRRTANGFTGWISYAYGRAVISDGDLGVRFPSDFDQRHKVVFAAVVESPWQRSRILSGFELAPIVSYNSGHPYNLLAGADINGDNHFTNDRPPGAPRNSGLGPSYAAFDIRLSKRINLGERANLQFTAEGFNIANRTNYATVNNIVGASFAPPFNVRGTSAVSPSQPLGYTAALPKREIQLGLRIGF